jgi:hypothetical protein
MWPAIVFSALSGVGFATAIALSFQPFERRSIRGRQIPDGTVALIAGIAAICLLLAIVFWLHYLVVGPVRHVNESLNQD